MKKEYESPDWEFVRVLIGENLMVSTIGEGGQQEDDIGNEEGGGFG